MNISDFLKKYYNSVKFILVHKSNIIPCQDWISLDSLKPISEIDKKTNEANTMFHEYYLNEGPIKVQERNGKYWIIDGHHRYYRGINTGYNYFLVENSMFYNPCSDNDNGNKLYNVYKERYNETKYYKKVDLFDNQSEEILKKFEKILGFPQVYFQRYKEIKQSKL